MNSACLSPKDFFRSAPPRYRLHHSVFTDRDFEFYDRVTPEALQGDSLGSSIKVRARYFLVTFAIGLYATFLLSRAAESAGIWVLGLTVSIITAGAIAFPPSDIARYGQLALEIWKNGKQP